MKKFIKYIFITFGSLLFVWAIMTLWAESLGGERNWVLGDLEAEKKILIVYDPDPFYNFDEQICLTFGEVFALRQVRVDIYSVEAAEKVNLPSFDLYVFCANTYNWRPDRAVSNYIKNEAPVKNKPVVAITLGSGSTEAAQRVLENVIREKQGNQVGSKSFWLLKPNDEERMQESNVKVALSMVHEWAQQIEETFNNNKNIK